MHFTSYSIPMSTVKAKLMSSLQSNEYASLRLIFKFCIIRRARMFYIPESRITTGKDSIECSMTIKYSERYICHRHLFTT